MGLNKEYVLTVARLLLLEPLTADYGTYDEALEKLTYSLECWHDLARRGFFPGLGEIERRVEAYTPETPIIEGVAVSFSLDQKRRAGRDIVQSFRFLMQRMIREYLNIEDMELDFDGKPWDELQRFNVMDAAQVERILRGVIQESQERIPEYIKVLVNARLLKSTPDGKAWTPNNSHCPQKGDWHKKALEYLQEAGIKPSWTEWTDPERGLIKRANGAPYSKNSFATMLKKL